MILETIDIFQKDTTHLGEIVGIERTNTKEVTIWLNGHKAVFTLSEAWALAKAIREVAK